MKAMRYIWIVAMLSVLCGTIQAVTYGKSYKPQHQHRPAYFHAQASTDMPTVRMGSVSSATMYSGSSLPLAAATGVMTADDNNPSKAPGRPRRVIGDGDEEEKPEGWTDPYEDPLGDAVLPLMLLLGAYCGFVYYRRKKKVKSLNR